MKIVIQYLFTCTLFAGIWMYGSGCEDKQSADEKSERAEHTQKELPVFEGAIRYEASASGPNANDVNVFYQFTPGEIDIYFSGDKFRMVEHGGLSNGNIIIDAAKTEVFHLDTMEKVAYRGVYSDLDAASETIRQQMPDHFSPTLEQTAEKETISGYECRKYKVVRSGFMRTGSEIFIWATEDFRFPHARFDIQTDANKVIVPIPLLIGFKDGAILKMQITDGDLTVIYRATKITKSKIDDSLFTVPATYTIQ